MNLPPAPFGGTVYWNNRLMGDPETGFAVHEVFYEDDDHSVLSWTEEPITLEGFSDRDDAIKFVELILNDLKRMDIMLTDNTGSG